MHRVIVLLQLAALPGFCCVKKNVERDNRKKVVKIINDMIVEDMRKEFGGVIVGSHSSTSTPIQEQSESSK
jgi:hypothetical protein